MSFNWNLQVPFAYRTNHITLRELESWLAPNMPRSSIRRHLAVLHSREGRLGVGSAWRVCPHPVSPASQRCESFHQSQEFYLPDGGVEIGGIAIDYVWEDGPDANDWHDGVPTGGVPIQGTPEAARFGIHANVGTPGSSGFESWHGQPVEVDGFGTATGGGAHPAPAIDPDYPLPPEHDPYYDGPPPTTEEEIVHTLDQPVRIYDSRPGEDALYDDGKGKFAAGEKRDVRVSTDATLEAVFVNITVANTVGAGFVTAYGGLLANTPKASNVNWSDTGDVFPNLALVPVHDDHIHVFAAGETDVIVDLQGVIRKV